MTSARQNEIRRLIVLKPYLAELSVLVGRSVGAGELLPIEASIFPERGHPPQRGLMVRATISFDDRLSAAFGTMIERLHVLNGSPVLLWLPKSNDCGLLPLGSLMEINFAFPFELIPEGILVVATGDGFDRLLLDFGAENDGSRYLEIEICGPNWSRVEVPK